jgi:DNA-binding transcriptional ArsR family regulator
MIGIVGSQDSVRLVSEVAQGMDLAEEVIVRAYGNPEEAPALAAEIDPACSVILFTGRVPFVLTRARLELTAFSDYVPHSGVDLYRTLVVLLQRFEGGLPRVSIDTIDGEVIRENFAEVGLEPPVHVFDLDPVLSEGGAGTDAIAGFHQRLYEAGAVDLCITCLASVRDRLQAADVPVERVEHTHGQLRDSLRWATLTSQLQRSEAAQVAALSLTDAVDDQRDQTEVAAVLQTLASQLQGELVTSESGAATIVTTRGAVERQLTGSDAFRSTLERLAAAGAWAGVGLGHSVAHAYEQARYAKTVAQATLEHQVVLPDGTVLRLGDGSDHPLRVRDPGERLQRIARRGGIGHMTLSRLQAAMATLGRSDVTAKELARAYGVEPRSARRLLNALLKAGVAEPAGAMSAARAGRPQVVYKINLEALLDSTADDDTPDLIATRRGK